jgi:hypothetical protein
MLLPGALLALFMTGFWLHCLTDVILTPAADCRGIPKPAWIVVITLTFIGGTVAWLIARRPARCPSTPPAGPTRTAGRPRSRRTPAGPSLPKRGPGAWVSAGETEPAGPRGPDDDPEFLRALDRAIGGNSQAGGEV